mmetsp:Transcript_9981/g.41906  ORF Transcript_9981/g.41906 Transcript_9981/m.41906 type:complete len:313 (-) Transcript_9981:9-947(-)
MVSHWNAPSSAPSMMDTPSSSNANGYSPSRSRVACSRFSACAPGSIRSPAVARTSTVVVARAASGTVRIATSSSGFRLAAPCSGSDANDDSPGLSCSNVSSSSTKSPDGSTSNRNTCTRLPVLPASNTTAYLRVSATIPPPPAACTTGDAPPRACALASCMAWRFGRRPAPRTSSVRSCTCPCDEKSRLSLGALGMSVTTARIRNRGTDATARIPRNRHILSAMLSLPKVRRGPILGDGPAVSNERSSDGLRDRTIVSSSTSERTPGLATEPSSIPDDSEGDARRSTDATQYPISHAFARGSSEATSSTRAA